MLLQWYINKKISNKKDSQNITHCVNGIDLKSLHSRGWFLPFTSLIFSCSSWKFRKYLESDSHVMKQNKVWTARYNNVTSKLKAKRFHQVARNSYPVQLWCCYDSHFWPFGWITSAHFQVQKWERIRHLYAQTRKKCSRKKSLGVAFIADSVLL